MARSVYVWVSGLCLNLVRSHTLCAHPSLSACKDNRQRLVTVSVRDRAALWLDRGIYLQIKDTQTDTSCTEMSAFTYVHVCVWKADKGCMWGQILVSWHTWGFTINIWSETSQCDSEGNSYGATWLVSFLVMKRFPDLVRLKYHVAIISHVWTWLNHSSRLTWQKICRKLAFFGSQIWFIYIRLSLFLFLYTFLCNLHFILKIFFITCFLYDEDLLFRWRERTEENDLMSLRGRVMLLW